MRHYLLVLFRNLGREKLYSAINVAGLALGLASCLILGLYLRSQLTYDRHYPGHENIYRLEHDYTVSGQSTRFAITPEALGSMLAAEYPDKIRTYVRFQANDNNGGVSMRRVDQPEKVFYWDGSFFVDQNVFEVLPVRVLAGDPKTALVDGNTIAISESVARAYFGEENPIGKMMASDSGNPNKVTLVFADLPPNTHLRYNFLWSYNRPYLRLSDNPTERLRQLVRPQSRTYTYLVMHPSFRPAEWQEMSDAFYRKYMVDVLKAEDTEWRSWLQPMRDVHLYSDVTYDLPTGNRAYVFGCAAVALIILVIACINYMNLATARAARRARSVGFRKILGASRISLALQFMGEALFFTFIALVLAVVIVQLALGFTPINSLMDGHVSMDLFHDPQLALWLAASALGVGLLSGLYPAFHLSSWAPLTALAGRQPAPRGNLRLREWLVLAQFTISATAIACTLLMLAQMRYVANRPLGFEREHRLMVSLRGAPVIEKIAAIRNELLGNSSIRSVGVAQQTPADGARSGSRPVELETNGGAMEQHLFRVMSIGEGYEQVLDLKLKEGRGLYSDSFSDVGADLLVNEALVNAMGWTDPLGKRVLGGRVVGVLRDFNFRSLKFQVEPLVVRRLNNDMSRISDLDKPFEQRHLILDITGADVGETLAFVRRVVTAADTRHPFEFRFLDEALERQYRAELSLTKLIGIFAGVSIFIACMGLFGLAAFTTEQRSREIGTRKVLGATAWQIVGMLSRRIFVLVLIACLLASAASWFAIDEWLAGFAYRAGVNPLIFLVSAAAASAVAFGAVAAQSWRIASADPVQALRYR